jgi:murein L,D-transpeptidase YcbB/YkuD
MSPKHHRFASALVASAAALALVPLLTAADTAISPPPAVAPAGAAPLSAADGEAIAAVLRAAPAQGIAAPNLAADIAELNAPDAEGRVGAEDRLAHAAIAYARAEHGMDLDPPSIDDDFALRAPFDAAGEFAQARASGQVAAWLAAQTRKDPAYLALVAARARYEDIDAHGGWGEIASGKPLRAGVRDRRVPALRRRLAAEGYDASAPADPKAVNVFDPALAKALADFQDHHGLKPDGVLTAQTLTALNVSAHDRLAALDANLERDRWEPIAMPATRIEADLAGPEVALFQDGRPTLAMRAVAGEEKRPTPMFASEVTAVKFNPPWIVPNDIARKEIYPKGRGYMARNDFHVVDGRLEQRAGPKSSLGYVKFEIADRFEVYMHDTPARSLFAASKRWKSHGCVRLAAPRQLAAILLGWSPAQVDQAIAAGATKTYALETHIPVYTVYRTAWVAPDGHVSFRADVYGWDDEIAAALAGAPQPKHTHDEAAGV